MKLVSLKCPHCGGTLEAPEGTKQTKCPFCETSILIDDEIQHVRFDNSEQAGYDFEKGRIRAQQDRAVQQAEYNQAYIRAQQEAERKKENRKWWIIGWIFFFPIPLTVLIAKSKKLKPAVKIAVIAALWVAIFILGMISNKNNQTVEPSGTEAESVWSTEITPIEDFKYYIDGSTITISEYRGSDRKIHIADSYDIDGSKYYVVALEGVFALCRVDSVIIPEGVKSIADNAFNSSQVKYLYLPSTLIDFNGWDYFHDGEKLYFGGEEDQWNTLYTGERSELDFTQIVCNARIQDLK